MNYLAREWQYKALGFVSYGGASGGIHGVDVARQLLAALKVVPLQEAVMVPHVLQHVGPDMHFMPNATHIASAGAMLDELRRWTDALADLRQQARMA